MKGKGRAHAHRSWLLSTAFSLAAAGLACDGGGPAPVPVDGGVLQISGLIDHCPVIQSVGVSPSVVTVGVPAMVSAIATDQDMGDVLTYAWSSGNGSFADPTHPGSAYTCAAPGMPTVSVDVSDGRCLTRAALAVACQAAASN